MDNLKTFLRKMSFWVIFIIFFIVGKEAVHYMKSENDTRQSIKKVDAEFNDIIETVRSEGKNGEILSENLRLKVMEETKKRLSTTTNQLEKLNTVTYQFYGFYFMNTRARFDYCEGLGIRITTFVNAFKSSHKNELEKADAVFHEQNISKEKLWSIISNTSSFKNTLELDMESAENQGVSKEEFCVYLASEDSIDLVNEMHFSKRATDQWKILMNTPLSVLN